MFWSFSWWFKWLCIVLSVFDWRIVSVVGTCLVSEGLDVGNMMETLQYKPPVCEDDLKWRWAASAEQRVCVGDEGCVLGGNTIMGFFSMETHKPTGQPDISQQPHHSHTEKGGWVGGWGLECGRLSRGMETNRPLSPSASLSLCLSSISLFTFSLIKPHLSHLKTSLGFNEKWLLGSHCN